MKLIHLTNGMTAIVDDIDYDRISIYRWRAKPDLSSSKPRWYAYRDRQDGSVVAMHQEVLGVHPGLMIDHRDHNGLNNCRSNLRYATNAENQQNRQKHRGSSRFKGVTLIPARYQARIKLRGKTKHLGYFKTEEEAARAYDAAAREYFPETACLNFP